MASSAAAAGPSSSPPSASSGGGDGGRKERKEALGWIEWGRGWFAIVWEFLFQRIAASHVENPLPLPPLDDVTCIVTGATSGIGLEIARSFLSFNKWCLELLFFLHPSYGLDRSWAFRLSKILHLWCYWMEACTLTSDNRSEDVHWGTAIFSSADVYIQIDACHILDHNKCPWLLIRNAFRGGN